MDNEQLIKYLENRIILAKEAIDSGEYNKKWIFMYETRIDTYYEVIQYIKCNSLNK